MSTPIHNAAPVDAVTLRTIRAMVRAGRPFAALTCYDATTARWLERAGVHVLLVGDSAAQVVLGHPSTIHMPLDIAVALTAAVKRGAPSRLVMADMPFMSYHTGSADAVRHAGRFMTEGLADVVKLEVDGSFAPLIRDLTRAGIPICAHVGYRPQTMALDGGPGSAGRTAADAQRIVDDAAACAEAGAVMLLVEAVPPEVSRRIIETTGLPLIGIGAGPDCHGQVLVLHDLLGLTDRQPPFAPAMAALGAQVQSVAQAWVARVERREVTDHRYTMRSAPQPATPNREDASGG